MKSDPLLSPFKLRHLTIRNRVLSTAHAPAYEEDGFPKDRYRLYHEEKAKGGIGLTVIGGSTNIAPDSPSVFGQLYAGEDKIIPWFQRLTEGVRSHGAAVMCQITHMGRRTAWDNGDWLPVVGPSGLRERAHRSLPKAMELSDMERIIEQFANAAKRVKEGGFDGIEVLSHSHLIGQFLSPLVNDREDDFGGSLENRMRFPLQVIRAVRDAVGPEFIFGMRVTGDELETAGLTAEECVKIAKRIEGTGAVDFLNILAGAPYDDLGLAGWVPPMGMPSAPHLTVAGQIRSAVDLPIFHGGGVADLATARHAITSGYADMIGMTRAHIADPHLMVKLARDHENRIRPCVGLGYCVDRVNQGKDAVCGHNASTGREASMPHVLGFADQKKRVVVVGGGPGGLEAARISAERGHEVVLLEASPNLGGQLRLAAGAETRKQIWGVADWLVQEVERLNVDIRLNIFAEPEDITALSPDLVVIATGGWPKLPSFPGAELIHSTWDVLGGDVRPQGDVLILDEIGDHAALVCAELMAANGCSVHLTTPDRAVAQELGPTNSAVVLRGLAQKKVTFSCFQEITGAEADGNRKRITLRHVLTKALTTQIVDHCIVEQGTSPIDDLYEGLKHLSRNEGRWDQKAMTKGTDPFQPFQTGEGFLLARIGDAVAGRNIHAAMFDALRFCKDQ